VGVDPSTVYRWEHGKTAPGREIWPKLARALKITLGQLDDLLQEGTAYAAQKSDSEVRRPAAGLVPVMVEGQTIWLPVDVKALAAAGEQAAPRAATELHSGTSPATATADGDAMSPLTRRTLLKLGLAATSLPAFGLDDLERVAKAMADARRYFDSGVVDYLRGQLAVCKADDGKDGPRKALPLVLGVVGAVEEHARQVKPAIGHELLKVGAEGAEFAGWLFRDIRDFDRTLYWYDRASEWAQETDDLAMQGYVLLKKSQLAFDLREPAQMLSLAQTARRGRRSLPMRVQAEAVQQEARADVMLGATADAVEQKLDEARKLLDTPDSGPSSSLGAHYNHTLLTMQTAICYAEAGAPRRAVELYDQSLVEDRFSSRDYGFFLSLRAGSLALAGEPDEAARTGIDSATRADSTNSSRTKKELGRVLEYLEPWKNRPAVADLRKACGPSGTATRR
jgi:tetratricopeptide (TPR) repeat protein